MNEHLIADLSRFVDERAVTMSETTGHVALNIVRPEVSLSVLIPKLVLEWWVEVNDTYPAARRSWIGATTPAMTLRQNRSSPRT